MIPAKKKLLFLIKQKYMVKLLMAGLPTTSAWLCDVLNWPNMLCTINTVGGYGFRSMQTFNEVNLKMHAITT